MLKKETKNIIGLSEDKKTFIVYPRGMYENVKSSGFSLIKERMDQLWNFFELMNFKFNIVGERIEITIEDDPDRPINLYIHGIQEERNYIYLSTQEFYKKPKDSPYTYISIGDPINIEKFKKRISEIINKIMEKRSSRMQKEDMVKKTSLIEKEFYTNFQKPAFIIAFSEHNVEDNTVRVLVYVSLSEFIDMKDSNSAYRYPFFIYLYEEGAFRLEALKTYPLVRFFSEQGSDIKEIVQMPNANELQERIKSLQQVGQFLKSTQQQLDRFFNQKKDVL